MCSDYPKFEILGFRYFSFYEQWEKINLLALLLAS